MLRVHTQPFLTNKRMGDYYGFVKPARDVWVARVCEYIDIPEMPLDLLILIAEYGSTFMIEWSESCPRCDSLGEGHRINGIKVPFDRIRYATHTEVPITLAVCEMPEFKKDGIAGVEMLSDWSWHVRRPSQRETHHKRARSLSNPTGKPFTGIQGLPRDAYVIKDGKNVKATIDECVDPRTVVYHCQLVATGTLHFHEDVF